MIVSNCYRCFSLQRSVSGSCQKLRRMCQRWMGGPQYSLTSLRRGSPWCDPTGTSNALKVGRVSECTARLMAGLRAAAGKPTNLAKINSVRQQPNESPAAFLERIMEAFRQYTPMDPQADESQAAVMLMFVNQAAPDIRRKLQKM